MPRHVATADRAPGYAQIRLGPEPVIRRVLSIAGWMASLAVLALVTTAITHLFASNMPVQRTAAWHQIVDPLLQQTVGPVIDTHTTPAIKRHPDVRISTASDANASQPAKPPGGGLRMDGALELTAIRGAGKTAE